MGTGEEEGCGDAKEGWDVVDEVGVVHDFGSTWRPDTRR